MLVVDLTIMVSRDVARGEFRLTQVATVHEPGICSEATSGTFTSWVVPLKLSASLISPLVVQVGLLVSVPVLPLPEESAVVVPEPSSIFHQPTRALV